MSYDKIQADADTEVYMCGSPTLIESLKNDFDQAEKQHVYYEKFI